MNLEKNYMTTESLFFDTYALIEIFKQNEVYKIYRNKRIVTTKLNIFELYYRIAGDFGKEIAEIILNDYYLFTIDFDEKIIIEAAHFKLLNKKKKLSMTDCIGYIIAKSNGIKFLTGDKEFENLENVEFVK